MSRRFPAPFRSFACKLASLLMISSAAAVEDAWREVLRHFNYPDSWGSECLGKAPVTLDGRVHSLQFAPDGKALYAVSNSILEIEWPSKRMAAVWLASKDQGIGRASFSPDFSLFARMSEGDEVCIYDTTDNKLLHRLGKRASGSTTVAWSPDGQLIAFGGTGEILIHRSKTGEFHRRIPQGTGAIIDLTWSADGKWLAASNWDEPAKGSRTFLHALTGEAAPLILPGIGHTKASFSPDSRILARVNERSLSYWDLAAGKVTYQQEDFYNFVIHSPDGRFLAVGGYNNLEIRDPRTGAEIFRSRDEPLYSGIFSAAFSPDGSVLAYGVEDRLKFRDTKTWAEIDPDEILRAPVTAAAFSEDGRHLVTGGMTGDLVLWDWEKKTPLWIAKAAPNQFGILALSISPDKRWIGVAQDPRLDGGSTVSMVDFASGKQRAYVAGGQSHAAPLFLKDRGTAWIGGSGGNLIEWDPEAKRILRKVPIPSLRGMTGNFNVLEADPVASGWIRHSSGRINPESGDEVPLVANTGIAPELVEIASRTHDSVFSYSTIRNLPLGRPITPWRHDDGPSVTHPSGLMVFVGKAGDGVRVYDMLSETEVHGIRPAPGAVKCLALSPDGKTLVVGSSGGLRYVPLLDADRPHGRFSGIPHLGWTVSRLQAQSLPTFTPKEELKFTPAPEPKPLPPPGNEELWQLMGSEQEWEAYQAAWVLGKQPGFSGFLAGKLVPAGEVSPELKGLLEGLLKDASSAVRKTAARQWLDLGLPLDKATYDTLREGGLPTTMPPAFERDVYASGVSGFSGVSDGTNPESPKSPERLAPLSAHKRMMRAVMILGDDRGEESRKLLEKLAGGRETSPLTMAAKRALVRRGK